MADFNDTLVIFGGEDIEEQAARKVALSKGCAIATATAQGISVHSGSAYKADGYALDDGGNSVNKAVIFECSLSSAGDLPVVKICDHHNPGDPGYGAGPKDFWLGSSLGQLCNYLEVPATSELEYIAAGDHCPVQAYLGNCPGINPEKFLNFRVNGIADFSGKPIQEVRADITLAQNILSEAKLVNGVRDLRSLGKVEELPEAAMSMGEAYMALHPDRDRERNLTGNMKYVLGGHTTPEDVKNFMKWGKTLPNKVGEPYGNPIRGFAGVIVTPEK